MGPQTHCWDHENCLSSLPVGTPQTVSKDEAPCILSWGDSVSVTEVGLLKSSFCVSLSLASESVSRSCPTLCDPMDSSTPGSFVHGILQARILEWVAIPSPGDLSDLGIKPGSPTSQADSLPSEPPGMTIKKAEH